MNQRKKLIRDLANLMAEGQGITREMKQYGPWDQYGDEEAPLFIVVNTDDYDEIPQALFDRSRENSKEREKVCHQLRMVCRDHRTFMDAYNDAMQMSDCIATGATA